jgi:hypothetical protein
VIDNTAGAAAPSGTSANVTTPIGPTAGATLQSGKNADLRSGVTCLIDTQLCA